MPSDKRRKYAPGRFDFCKQCGDFTERIADGRCRPCHHKHQRAYLESKRGGNKTAALSKSQT